MVQDSKVYSCHSINKRVVDLPCGMARCTFRTLLPSLLLWS